MERKNRMNWYKYAKDFHGRNIINHKIRYLESIKSTIEGLSDMVFQSGTLAKTSNMNIISSKKISSYPDLRDILIEADSIALDSPWKFSILCKEALSAIDNKVVELKRDRDLINEGDKYRYQKGWV